MANGDILIKQVHNIGKIKLLKLAEIASFNNYPQKIEVGLIKYIPETIEYLFLNGLTWLKIRGFFQLFQGISLFFGQRFGNVNSDIDQQVAGSVCAE